MKYRFIALQVQAAPRLVPSRVRRMRPAANNEHHQDWKLLVVETLFYERDQALRAEEVVEGGAKHDHVCEV